MQPLSRPEIEELVRRAGFTGADADTAVAIALAESGGDPACYNPETQANPAPNMGSVGLFQIFRWQHPEFSAWDLTDPLLNARAAYFVYVQAGRTFSRWSTYLNGAYKKFLQPPLSYASAAPEPGGVL
jgi:hypothetical protein